VTTQIPDLIYYGSGRRRDLMATPLEAYFERTERPDFNCSFSACWRGYIATWRLVDGRLFLVHLKPAMDEGTKLSVGTLFPGHGRRVFASWFTGRLRIPEGRCLAFMDGGFMNAYERETLVTVAKGVAVETRVLDLAATPESDWPAEVMGEGWW
jgi:hypothetical protein